MASVTMPVDGAPVGDLPPPGPDIAAEENADNSVATAVVLTCFFLIAALLVFVWWLRRRQDRRDSQDVETDPLKGTLKPDDKEEVDTAGEEPSSSPAPLTGSGFGGRRFSSKLQQGRRKSTCRRLPRNLTGPVNMHPRSFDTGEDKLSPNAAMTPLGPNSRLSPVPSAGVMGSPTSTLPATTPAAGRASDLRGASTPGYHNLGPTPLAVSGGADTPPPPSGLVPTPSFGRGNGPSSAVTAPLTTPLSMGRGAGKPTNASPKLLRPKRVSRSRSSTSVTNVNADLTLTPVVTPVSEGNHVLDALEEVNKSPVQRRHSMAIRKKTTE
eukprot:Hpha_TRINITY_DN15471_c5_g8::TRINITY_DN15471_c5_g8_i1::g.176746::m.176746